MYITLAVLAFGLIIAIHELGHFICAKAMNVKVLEFSVGMGPKILSKQGKETLYSLRLIPFGGFCSMEGEYGETLEGDKDKDEDDKRRDIAFTNYVLAEGVSLRENGNITRAEPERFGPATPADEEDIEQDPRSFISQKIWKRIVILAAGSVFNFIAAFIIVMLLSAGADGYIGTVLESVHDTLPEYGQSEILPGDKILRLNGERLYYYNDYSLFMELYNDKPVTLTIQRGSDIIEYQRRSYTVDGEEVYRYALTFNTIRASFWENLKYSSYQTVNFIRIIRVSISMMFSGEASLTDVAGPVGIIDAMNTVGKQSPSVIDAVYNIIYFTAFIGVNVAAVNLLPIPAMDGGRILFTLITWVAEKILNKKIDPKYENYINTGAFALLICLMVVIMYNDVMRIINN